MFGIDNLKQIVYSVIVNKKECLHGGKTKGFGIMKLKELKEKGILIEKLEEIVKAEREE